MVTGARLDNVEPVMVGRRLVLGLGFWQWKVLIGLENIQPVVLTPTLRSDFVGEWVEFC